MTGTVHIVVAMKPMAGNFVANAKKHGVAGLNIDGARIGTSEVLKAGAGGLLSNVRDQKEYPEAPGFVQAAGGRWPANVILQHLVGCRRVGVRKVRGNPHLGQKNPELVKQYGGGSFGGGKVTPGGGYAGEDGTEVVEHWECVQGCPVRGMDEQSGDTSSTRSSGNMNNPKRGGNTKPAWGMSDGRETTDYRDFGGASRYFKVIKEDRHE